MRTGVMAGIKAALIAYAVALWPAVAQAEWLEASSSHFVVYSDDNVRDVQRFSEQLERYHAAMELLTAYKYAQPSPSNRVTVYTVSSVEQVRQLAQTKSRYLGGFYLPRAGGSLAIIPKVNSGTGVAGPSMLVLLHEYAHHFMISARAAAMPRWVSEGGAEFFASAAFEADGSISLGRPAVHRAYELFMERDVTAEDLLDPDQYAKRSNPRSYDAFYGKSWLLYHYLNIDDARQGQLDRYLAEIGRGKSSREAGLAVFGDFGQLEKDLDRYLKRRTMLSFKLGAERVPIGPVNIRRLSPGEAAMMPVRIRSKVGVDEKTAPAVLADARGVAARFPGDAAVLAALAEAEYDAGNDDAAIDAANRALAIDPAQANASVQLGYALFRKADKADDRVAAFKAARAPFVRLNKRESDHPLPLIYYYRSFVEAGLEPTPLAMQGLERAVELAPFDFGLSMTLAMQLVRLGRREDALRHLTPIAYNPHGGGLAGVAQKVIVRLNTDPAWKGEGSLADEAATAEDIEEE